MPSENPPDPPFLRLAALILRELQADDVRVIEPGAATPVAPNVLGAQLPDGRHVAVTFASAPPDAAALARRLEILVRTFAHSLDELSDRRRGGRAPVARSLHDELRGLTTRAQAIDAVVLDAHSPVVWGSSRRRNPHEDLERTAELDEQLHRLHASRLELLGPVSSGPAQDVEPPPSSGEGAEVRSIVVRVGASNERGDGPAPGGGEAGARGGVDGADTSGENEIFTDVHRLSLSSRIAGEASDPSIPAPFESMPMLREVRGEDDESGDDEGEEDGLPEASVRAMRAVRLLPGIAQLRRGRHLHHVERGDDLGYVAQAFAGIYVLVLVFAAPFDELRAERALMEALPRIERLVLALPPLDPTPEPRANVVSLRRSRRR